MNYKEALAAITEILVSLVPPGFAIHEDVLLADIRSIDPQIIVDLIAAAKSNFGISLTVATIDHCDTVSDLSSLVAALVIQREATRFELSANNDAENAARVEYRVWFGTNRRPVATDSEIVEFSGMRDTRIHYGSCNVFVPRSHQIGSLGSAPWRRILTGIDDRLQLLGVEHLPSEAYWAKLKEALGNEDIDDRDAIVFIHGYNVSFSEAALRAAQIGYDLAFRGAMIFFSWPSQGALSGYMADEATIEASEAAIANFLTDTATLLGARSVHIIAHSMGNRGLLRAVNKIVAVAGRRSEVTFEQIILAAADVDADTFKQLASAYGQVCRRATLYVSAKDQAVATSGKLHSFQRIGFAPPISVVPGFDTIDVANVDLSLLGHGYVSEARQVLNDMHALINFGAAPRRRFGLREAQTAEGAQYWIVGE